jgi:octaprenyl-diphosphate synthase
MSATMRQFGELVGLAFQIKDDIFDYGSDDGIGKPTGNDLRERKMTLPLIYVLNTAPKNIKKELISIVKNHNEDPKYIARGIELVVSGGGIKYATAKMMELKEQALQLLEGIPDSESKRSIIGLVEYTTQRKK